MSILVLVALSLTLSSTSSQLCDVSSVVDDKPDSGKYYSAEANNTCYVFGLETHTLKSARNVCRRLGGWLADVHSWTGNYLQQLISDEKASDKDFDVDYWIGLLWNPHLEYWYWDSGNKEPISFEGPGYTFIFISDKKYCVTMSSKTVTRHKCEEKKAVICLIDLPSDGQERANDSQCNPRCVKYIQEYRMIATPPSPVDSEDTTTMSVDDNNAMASNHSNATSCDQVLDCERDQIEDYMILTAIDHHWDHTGVEDSEFRAGAEGVAFPNVRKLEVFILAALGGLCGILLIMTIATFGLYRKYRRLFIATATPIKLSMIDILQADSPSNSRHGTLGAHSRPAGEPTTEFLYSNPYNTYATADGEDGNSAEGACLISQKNGGPARASSGGAADGDAQRGYFSDHYQVLNRDGQPVDEAHSMNVYGMESASESLPFSAEANIYEES